MEKVKLTRTGDAPLAFDGEVAAEATGDVHGGEELTRWHDLSLYRMASGRYVVAIDYLTRWQGESAHSSAQVCQSTEDVQRLLRDYDPAQFAVRCRELNDRSRDSNERMVAQLRSVYEHRVSRLLSDVDDLVEHVS